MVYRSIMYSFVFFLGLCNVKTSRKNSTSQINKKHGNSYPMAYALFAITRELFSLVIAAHET